MGTMFNATTLVLGAFFLILSCGKSPPPDDLGSEEEAAVFSAGHRLTASQDNFFRTWLKNYENREKVWWFEMIRVPEVFSRLASRDLSQVSDEKLAASAPVIAILDSGVDYEHPALKANIWENPAPGQAGCLNDRWGCDTTVGGGEFGSGPAWPFGTQGPGQHCRDLGGGIKVGDTACSHGTHIAGLLVGSQRDEVPGLCPFCKIFPVRVVEGIDGEGKVPDDAILKALRYIKKINEQHGGVIRVVNSSFGKFERSLLVQEAVRDLTDSGVLVVAAAGNEGVQDEVFPAAFEDALSVTAVGASGEKSWYSNFGPWTDMAAPGGNRNPEDPEAVALDKAAVASLIPGSGLGQSQGTSVAAPMVSGVAGLLWMLFPEENVSLIRERILRSANRNLYAPGFADGRNTAYLRLVEGQVVPLLGAGLLDAMAAFEGRDQGKHGGKSYDRVSPGCGTLGIPGESRPSLSVSLLLFLIPLLLGFLTAKRELK